MASLEMHDLREGRSRVQVWTKQAGPLGGAGGIELLEVDEREDEAPARPVGKSLRLTVGPMDVPQDGMPTLDSLVREALPREVAVRIVAELDGDNLIDPGHHGAQRKGRLFNGLPVPGVVTGLNFHVDAPFNLSADRTNILDDAFNEWLLGRIADAACRFLAEVRQEESYRQQAFRLVPADLAYGRSKGFGELTQRFAKVHDRLREEARQLGVLPAIDEGEPLRPGEALALRGADARKAIVARAIQALIGGQPLDLFSKTRTKIRAETLRLALILDDSYQADVARALGHEEFFAPRWMRAALADPGWRARTAERNPRWYTYLFTYIARGDVTDNLDDFLDVAWVPGLSHEDESITPREATLLEDTSTADLVAVRDGLRVAGEAEVQAGWRFAHPNFVRAYLDAKAAIDTLRHGARRLVLCHS
jgi:hypothetical protein